MYMSMYTVAEFRKNIKKALDEAASGELVVIRRNNDGFNVSLYGSFKELTPAPSTTVTIPSEMTRATVKISKPIEERLVKKSTLKEDYGTCKIHGTPLDWRGKCLQVGCKYA